MKKIRIYNLSDCIIFSLILLSLMPSVTFSIVPAEIFPWALIFAILYTKRYNVSFIYFLVFLVINTLIGILTTNGVYMGEAVRSLAAFLNPFFIFLLISQAPNKYVNYIYKIAKFYFLFLIILGILQYFNLIAFLNPIFKFVIPRGSAISTGGIRGVRLLSSEPARATYEMFYLYLIFRNDLNKKWGFFSDILFTLYVILILKSGTGIILLGLFYLLFYSKYFIIILIIILSFIPVLGFLNHIYVFNNMAIILLINLFENPSNFMEILFDASGFRLISIYSSFKYSFYHPFGGGIGNWQKTSLEAFNLTSFHPQDLSYFRYFGEGQWTPVRPNSYLSSFALDTGLVGIFFILFFLYLMLREYWKISKINNVYIILFFFYLFFVGEVGNPVPWIVTITLLKYNKSKISV